MRKGRIGEAGGVRFMEGGGGIRITNCKPAYAVFISTLQEQPVGSSAACKRHFLGWVEMEEEPL